jgi:hypothetical protein
MPLPTIVFNNATGSDTAASGYGPATAVSGTGASFTNTSAVVDVSADAPNLSTLAAGDLFWGATTSGRQYSIIVSVDNILKTITCTDAFAVTEASRNWGVGGKRKTIDNTNSRGIFSSTNGKAGWTVSIEDDQSITSTLTISVVADTTSGPFMIKGADSADHPVITQTANAANFTASGIANGFSIRNLKLTNSNATKTAAFGFITTTTTIADFSDCIFGDSVNQLLSGLQQVTNSATLSLNKCLITSCTGDGINHTTGGGLTMRDCVVTGCVKGVDHSGSGGAINMSRCIIYNNTSDGVHASALAGIAIVNCTIHGNSGDGIDLTAAGGSSLTLTSIYNNNLTANGGYGINATAIVGARTSFIDYNNYGTGALANTSGSYPASTLTAGAHDVAVDPGYTNAATGNFMVANV